MHKIIMKENLYGKIFDNNLNVSYNSKQEIILKDTIDIDENLIAAKNAVSKFVNKVQIINKIGTDNINNFKSDVDTFFIFLSSNLTNNNETIDATIKNNISFTMNTNDNKIRKHISFT
jgi:hypothetical protein